MGPTPFYGARAEKPPQKADFVMKQTNICRRCGDITILEWRRFAANRKVRRMAASIPNTAPVVHFTPSRSRYQFLYCLVNRGTCV